MKEHHVYGGPGCGKTHYLCDQIERAVERFGIDKILVSSFTRAASKEVSNRSIVLSPDLHGTCHSICWRGLGRPEIAETRTHEFNESFGYEVSPHRLQIEEAGDPEWEPGKSDKLLQKYSLLRNRCEDVEELGNLELKNFAKAWESWKVDNGYLDFCDLIEQARETMPLPPGAPRVAFIDEAQDLSALEFSLVRKWAAHMEHAVFVGDDDQAIYQWAGADVHNLLDAPAESTIVLKRSHRLPRAIHRIANAFIHKCKVRQPKEFGCRDADGLACRFEDGRGSVPDLIRDEIGAERKVMLLASCGYMLQPLLEELRAAGIPWHNPYRATNGAWNPIRIGAKSTAHKLWCYLQGKMIDGEGPCWTGAQIEKWLQLIGAGMFRHGGRAQLARFAKERAGSMLGPLEWRAFFLSDPFENWENRDLGGKLERISDHWQKKYARTAAVSVTIARKSGIDALVSVPKVIVGTIHSVKGAETDTVIMLPDVSRQAMESAREGSVERDGLIHATEVLDPLLRTFYVGMTRARERLYVLPARDPAYRVPYLHKLL